MAQDIEITLNGARRMVADGMSVAALLDELQMAPKHVAVEVNLQLVPRATLADRRLARGDRLEVVTLVGGG